MLYRSYPCAGQPAAASHLETWQLERDVCERHVRQLKCVGDAPAWRVFGFQRKHISALCQNAPPGTFVGKAGRAAELVHVGQAYSEAGKFAILHDLTNCLRIGDVNIFENDGTFNAIDVKTNPNRTNKAQSRKIKSAAAVLWRTYARVPDRGLTATPCCEKEQVTARSCIRAPQARNDHLVGLMCTTKPKLRSFVLNSDGGSPSNTDGTQLA